MKTSVFVGTSLDGFIARRDGQFDFLALAAGEPHGYEEFIASVDAIVMGRKTYEVVLSMGEWAYGTRPVYVLSTHALSAPPAGAIVERLDASPAEVHARLEARGHQHVYIDGGATVQGFLRAGLVDRLVINRVPVLIGDGIPLFGPVDEDIHLRLVATHRHPSGAVQSEYALTRRPVGPD